MRTVAAVFSVVAVAAAGCGSGVGTTVKGGDTARGKQLFMNGEAGKAACAACHTLRAAGAKGTIGPDLDAAFGSDFAQGFEESTIRQVVADQIRFAGDYGPGNPVTMPKDLVTGEHVDDVAAYVASVAGFRKNRPGATAPPPSTTPTTGGGGELAAGKKAFMDNGCAACHTLQAAGATGKIGPDLDKLKTYAKQANKPLEDFIRESIVDPNAYVEKGYAKGVMPTTFGSLPKPTLDALVKFLAASAKG